MKIALLTPLAPSSLRRDHTPPAIIAALRDGLIAAGAEVEVYGASGTTRVRAPAETIARGAAQEEARRAIEAWECLHLARFFEEAARFDIVHNHAGLVALSYSHLVSIPIVTTLNGLPSPDLLPAYRAYADRTDYVAASVGSRCPELKYVATIRPGLAVADYVYAAEPGQHLVYLDPVNAESGAAEAVAVASRTGRTLVISAHVSDEVFFARSIAPHVSDGTVVMLEHSDPKLRERLLGNAFAVLHTVRYEQAFALPVLEAMARGTPVIALRGGAMAEFVEDGRTGFLVDDIDSAVRAVARIGELDRHACRDWVAENFARERMIAEFLALDAAILQREKPHARHADAPWGRWEVLLDEARYKVKRIRVTPGQRLSYQQHARRAEHWQVVEGVGLVTLDGRNFEVKAGESVNVPQGSAHRIANPGTTPLVFVEVQGGDYFGEDDIVRLEDDYGRSKS